MSREELDAVLKPDILTKPRYPTVRKPASEK